MICKTLQMPSLFSVGVTIHLPGVLQERKGHTFITLLETILWLECRSEPFVLFYPTD